MNKSLISYIQPQFLASRNSLPDSCVNTVGDTISMQVEPWFSHEVGKDFLKWENGGGFYYIILGEMTIFNSWFLYDKCMVQLIAFSVD